MAASKCPHCGGGQFEMLEAPFSQSRYRHSLVQCRHCGAPFGVLEFFNIADLMADQESEIKALHARLDEMRATLDRLAERLT